MLQVEMVESILIVSGTQVTTSADGEWYEPGFNIMTPLELEFPVSDQLVLSIRKRADATGTTFSNISTQTISATVTDPTNGQAVPSSLATEDSTHITLTVINSLVVVDPVMRVRVMDVLIRDASDQDFLTFRILVDDQNKPLHYIFVESNDMNQRASISVQGRSIYLSVKAGSDHYLLFSPYASLKETTLDKANFSYPLNTIFYKRQDSYNDEDFSFSISAYSDEFMRDVVSLMNVPSYDKAGVLLVDRKIYKDITENGVNPYVYISVNGQLSNISDSFRINFIV
jgi:hypothetical protein